MAAEAGQGLMSAVGSYARGDMGGVFKSAMGLVKTATGSGQKAEKYARATRTSPADVVCILILRGITMRSTAYRSRGVVARTPRLVQIHRKLGTQQVP